MKVFSWFIRVVESPLFHHFDVMFMFHYYCRKAFKIEFSSILVKIHFHLWYTKSMLSHTVNVFFFRWGKISRKCWQDLLHGITFHDITSISLMKSCGFYLHAGEIFMKQAISPIMRELLPCENFHVYSIKPFLYGNYSLYLNSRCSPWYYHSWKAPR